MTNWDRPWLGGNYLFSFQIKAFMSINVLVWLIATTAEKNAKCFSVAHIISAFISQNPEGLIFPFRLSNWVRNRLCDFP